HVSEQDTAYFEAFLVRLGDHYFLDLVIEDIEVDNTLALYHLFPVHTFSKVSFEEDRVNIEMFNSNWIIEMIENEKVRIKHEKAADMVLLTASTSELQKFILKYVEEPKAYSEPIVLTRDRSI
ncbi:MAG: hypothetical protein R3211_11455, partial [Balneolaceae bacterium]|nr:hypothetical protein [Balneolaceae bacterium]